MKARDAAKAQGISAINTRAKVLKLLADKDSAIAARTQERDSIGQQRDEAIGVLRNVAKGLTDWLAARYAFDEDAPTTRRGSLEDTKGDAQPDPHGAIP